MPTQPSTSRRPVALAAIFFVVTLCAFGAAFYLYDGAILVKDYIPSDLAELWTGAQATPVAGASSATNTRTVDGLVLPEGMPPEFALRLWQEQVDSQSTIARLAEGEVASLRVNDVTVRGDDAELAVTIAFNDGVTGDGVIGLRRFGDTWYVAFARANRGGGLLSASEPLPSIDEVDIAVLNTIIAESQKSAANAREYVEGHVQSVKVEGVQKGRDTATIAVEMNEDHEHGYANIIAIRTEQEGNPMWFLARFTKTGSKPL